MGIMSANQGFLPTSKCTISLRPRRVHDGPPEKPDDNAAHRPAEDEDGEDDIGPMPMLTSAPPDGGARKKRKSQSPFCPEGLFLTVT